MAMQERKKRGFAMTAVVLAGLALAVCLAGSALAADRIVLCEEFTATW